MNNEIKSDKESSSEDTNYQCPAFYIAHEFVYELVETLFDIEVILITNLSMLSDFERIGEIPGHKYTKFIDIPEEDRKKLYPHYCEYTQEEQEDIKLRHPPVPDEVWEELDKQVRIKHMKLIESKFNISMKDYPEDEDLYVWKVAHFVLHKLKLQETSMYCC